MRILIKVLIIFVTISSNVRCGVQEATYEDFDYSILPILKKFQYQISIKDSIISAKKAKSSYNYQSVYSTNFEKHFPFLEEELKNEMLLIIKNKKILRIDYENPNCIVFPIKALGNSVIREEWTELFLVYHNNSNNVCINRINDRNIDSTNIKKIDPYWFLILAKNNRHIRG